MAAAETKLDKETQDAVIALCSSVDDFNKIMTPSIKQKLKDKRSETRALKEQLLALMTAKGLTKIGNIFGRYNINLRKTKCKIPYHECVVPALTAHFASGGSKDAQVCASVVDAFMNDKNNRVEKQSVSVTAIKSKSVQFVGEGGSGGEDEDEAGDGDNTDDDLITGQNGSAAASTSAYANTNVPSSMKMQI